MPRQIVDGKLRCSRCKQHLPLSEFHRKAADPNGYASRCKHCSREIQWFIRYGITREQFDELLRIQKRRCAICRRKEPRYTNLSVDHDHDTGEVRGLLCSSCNPMVGYAQNSTKILKAAIRYLEGN